jgi:hypothetical protein
LDSITANGSETRHYRYEQIADKVSRLMGRALRPGDHSFHKKFSQKERVSVSTILQASCLKAGPD